MERLISMTARLDEIEFGYGNEFETAERSLELAFLFKKFLKQPLQLGFFVPCDLDGNVLSEPIPVSFGKCVNKRRRLYEPIYEEKEVKAYNEAKSRVLFEGFSQNIYSAEGSFEIVNIEANIQICIWEALPKYWIWNGHETIEDLVKYNLELTPTAKQQIGF